MHYVSLEISKEMLFFKEIRNYFVFFTIFGLSVFTRENSKYKFEIRVCSFLSIIFVFYSFFFAYAFDEFNHFNSISNTINNLTYIFILLTHSIIVIESIVRKETQLKLVQSLSSVDNLFNIKFKVRISILNLSI